MRFVINQANFSLVSLQLGPRTYYQVALLKEHVHPYTGENAADLFLHLELNDNGMRPKQLCCTAQLRMLSNEHLKGKG